MRTRHKELYEAQSIFEALAADGKLRDEGHEGMKPMAVETLARLGWRLLEDLPDWEEAEVKDPAAQGHFTYARVSLASARKSRAGQGVGASPRANDG